MRTARRWIGVSPALCSIACLVLAACAADDSVQAERADAVQESTPPITGALPPTTTGDTAPQDSGTAEPGEPADDIDTAGAITGLGDELFPELGAPGVDVISYDVDLDVVNASFDAVVTVVADVSDGLSHLVLDAKGFDVDAVVVDGSDAPFRQLDEELLIELAAERTVRVVAEIHYSADPVGEMSRVGLPVGWFNTTAGSYVLNEPDGARTWLPSNDHPSDKATWRFEITVPDELTAVANGELVQAGTATTPWIWEMDEPMATYLVQLVIGRYSILDASPVASVGGGEISITNVAPTGTASGLQPYFDETAAQIEFFEALFGPYPLDRYGLAFIESPSGLAMETQGRPQFSVDDFSGGTPGYRQQMLLSHELAHQWFGDAVSPALWSDIWLNESLTTYAEWLWTESAGFDDVEVRARAALRKRQIAGGSTGDPDVRDMFGFVTYDGGAVVVHALRLTIGDDAFFELMRRWVADHDGTSQTTATFIALAETVSGRELRTFFETWLYASDLPADFPS